MGLFKREREREEQTNRPTKMAMIPFTTKEGLQITMSQNAPCHFGSYSEQRDQTSGGRFDSLSTLARAWLRSRGSASSTTTFRTDRWRPETKSKRRTSQAIVGESLNLFVLSRLLSFCLLLLFFISFFLSFFLSCPTVVSLPGVAYLLSNLSPFGCSFFSACHNKFSSSRAQVKLFVWRYVKLICWEEFLFKFNHARVVLCCWHPRGM